MSVLAADIIEYASANLPLDDSTTSGGAIDLMRRPVFTDVAGTDIIELVSDGADTRLVNVAGRVVSGAVVTEVLTLNGTTPVDTVNAYERVESVFAQTTSGTRTVTVKDGAAGPTISTIPPNEVGFYRMFRNAFSSSSGTLDRYEKFFVKNTNGVNALLNALIQFTTDSASHISLGLATAQNDVGSVANRLAVPGGVSFVGLNVAQSVPGTDLAPGATIGVWIKENLPANTPAFKANFTTQTTGSTT